MKLLIYLKKTKLAEIEFMLFGNFFLFLAHVCVAFLSLIAFTMILGNRSSGWNGGLVYGYPSFAFKLPGPVVVYGEMTSALPFSGGAYGFVRAVLGPYLGFMVACCEFVYCTSYTVMKVWRLLSIPSMYGGDDVHGTEWITIVIMFIICFIFSAVGRLTFTLTNVTFVLILLLIYLFGTLGRVGTDDVNFTHYSAPVMMPMT